ncbi:uncharacterized protein E0L32_008303 [Thyridium curvatum]|uniref:Uncharacterized protein n=1 Tax=Thyridium curvatum TaxID=1093900 RepID=A0A507AWE3_9PEZI|nr:uncharacterized protein E0L32_008303 [Thyridium curvatum]TPX10734.1 hypothetical protein E0L32_008303 [Thyridium curvatum]
MAHPIAPTVIRGSEPPFLSLEPASPHLPITNEDHGVRSRPIPGVRCPTCAANGTEVWVIPGRACGYCGTPCF